MWSWDFFFFFFFLVVDHLTQVAAARSRSRPVVMFRVRGGRCRFLIITHNERVFFAICHKNVCVGCMVSCVSVCLRLNSRVWWRPLTFSAHGLVVRTLQEIKNYLRRVLLVLLAFKWAGGSFQLSKGAILRIGHLLNLMLKANREKHITWVTANCCH